VAVETLPGFVHLIISEGFPRRRSRHRVPIAPPIRAAPEPRKVMRQRSNAPRRSANRSHRLWPPRHRFRNEETLALAIKQWR
jgi:hypothetical protein